MRGVTFSELLFGFWFERFQLTRLMRGVTPFVYLVQHENPISTHTPHARRDWVHLLYTEYSLQFQLTRLMRGVTPRRPIIEKAHFHFNSHASCEA